MPRDNSNIKFHKVSGSERKTAYEQAENMGLLPAKAEVQVALLLRRKLVDEAAAAHARFLGEQPPAQRRHLTHADFTAAFGADPGDIRQIEDFAKIYGFAVKSVHLPSRMVHLQGTAEAILKAFRVELCEYGLPDRRTFHSYTGAIHVPQELADLVQAVLGLDNRPAAAPRMRVLGEKELLRTQNRKPDYFTPDEIAKLYQYPNVSCRDQCIGIIELGGGYRSADIKTYFRDLKLPEPQVTSVSVAGAGNQPTGNPNGPDGEVVLDIEVAAAVAPEAKIAVYFAPNTDAGFIAAVKTAIHDQTNRPSVISISWGGPESSWSMQAVHGMNAAFHDAALLGITVCCAAGDNGSSDGVRDHQPHVDFPASSPYALSCGGTKLAASNGKITQETVWHTQQHGSTGGGVSQVFPLPKWQEGVHAAGAQILKGRGVPDVAGDADPETGYVVLADGKEFVVGGTSAVAPLWAGLAAIINQQLGHSAGYLNPVLYGLPSREQAFRDITEGNNDTVTDSGDLYPAHPGWDACTGLGSPVGTALLRALTGREKKA